jgi:hypothetical protein
MILQMYPLVLNQCDWASERFFSTEAIAWLEEHVGPIIKNESFAQVVDRRSYTAKSFTDFGREVMSNRYFDAYMKTLQFKPKPISFEQHIVAEGWRYDRIWGVDFTKVIVDFKSKKPVPIALHELEIYDDNLAFQFRLGWL